MITSNALGHFVLVVHSPALSKTGTSLVLFKAQ